MKHCPLCEMNERLARLELGQKVLKEKLAEQNQRAKASVIRPHEHNRIDEIMGAKC